MRFFGNNHQPEQQIPPMYEHLPDPFAPESPIASGKTVAELWAEGDGFANAPLTADQQPQTVQRFGKIHQVMAAVATAGLLIAGTKLIFGGDQEKSSSTPETTTEQTVPLLVDETLPPSTSTITEKTIPVSDTSQVETETTVARTYAPFEVITVDLGAKNEEPRTYFEQQQSQSDLVPITLDEWAIDYANTIEDPVKRQEYIESELRFNAIWSGQSCVGPDVMIPSSFGPEAIELAEKFKPALNDEAYKVVIEQIKSAHSVEEIQSIARNTLITFGVENVEFIGYIEGVAESPQSYVAPSSSVETYVPYMSGILGALRYIPTDMISPIEDVTFTDSHYINNGEGVALHQLDSIVLGGAISAREVIHEFLHDVHEQACDTAGPRDVQLTEAYDAAMALDASGSYSGTDRVFPSDYSKTDEVELFAELGTALIMNGLRTEEDLQELSEDQRNAYIKLQELVIERMQKAMPNVDVVSWLELHKMYNISEGSNASIYEKGSNLAASSIDLMYQSGPLVEEMSMPAIAINCDNGDVRFIYNHVYDGWATIIIDDSAPKAVVDAAYQYMEATYPGSEVVPVITSDVNAYRSFPGASNSAIVLVVQTSDSV